HRIAEDVFALGRNLVAELARALAAKVAEDIDRALHLALGFGKGLALLARHFFAELGEPALENFGGLEQILAAPGCRQRSPRSLCLDGRVKRRPDVFRPRSLKQPD